MIEAVDPASSGRYTRLRLLGLIFWPIVAVTLLGIVTIFSGPVRRGVAINAAFYVIYAVLLLAAIRACQDADIAPAEPLGSWPAERRIWMTAMLLVPLLLMFSASSVWLTFAAAAAVVPEWAADQVAKRDQPAILERFSPTHRMLFALNIIVVAPIVEEFVFRGLLLRKWLARRGLWVGIIGSAAVFAVLHPHLLIGAFATAIVLGILYLGSGSLFPAILTHVLHNAVGVALLLGADRSEPATRAAPNIAELQTSWAIPAAMLVITALAIGALIAPFARRMRDEHGHRERRG